MAIRRVDTEAERKVARETIQRTVRAWAGEARLPEQATDIVEVFNALQIMYTALQNIVSTNAVMSTACKDIAREAIERLNEKTQ